MDCKNIKETLIQYSLDGLDDIEKNNIEIHLDNCSECKAYLSESTGLWNLLETWDEIEPDNQFVSNFWDKADAAKVEPKPGILSWIRDINLNWTLGGAMASIFLVCIVTFGVFSPDTRNNLFMSADEKDELVLLELDTALAKETSEVLSIYGPWDGGTDVNTNGGFN